MFSRNANVIRGLKKGLSNGHQSRTCKHSPILLQAGQTCRLHRKRVLWDSLAKKIDDADKFLEKLGFSLLDKVGASSRQTHSIYEKDDTFIFMLDIDVGTWHGIRAEGGIEYITVVRDGLIP